MIKRLIAYQPMMICFYIAHQIDKYEIEFLYSVYNRLMVWSIELNDWGGLDLWLPPPEIE